MFIMFQLVFLVAEPFVSIIETALEWFAVAAEDFLVSSNAPEWLTSLIVAGIIDGIGNILVFVPNIALLFLANSPDSGTLAREYKKVTLHAKSNTIPGTVAAAPDDPGAAIAAVARNAAGPPDGAAHDDPAGDRAEPHPGGASAQQRIARDRG